MSDCLAKDMGKLMVLTIDTDEQRIGMDNMMLAEGLQREAVGRGH
jgi:hypothetical protein